jgi:hypothetical protein
MTLRVRIIKDSEIKLYRTVAGTASVYGSEVWTVARKTKMRNRRNFLELHMLFCFG